MKYPAIIELLPSYLQGPNISKHVGIIEEQNQRLYKNLDLLSDWNVLERPILIERNQTAAYTCTVNIHINTNAPIKNIITDGLTDDVNETYTEDELITNLTITKTETDNTHAQVMPDFSVTVETYEGITYQKGYPENDDTLGDIYDHDEFIDIMGKLLGIPRRIYKETASSPVYPLYFTKRFVRGTNLGDKITEDDYYYVQRLLKFITEKDTKPLVVLMAELLYEWSNIYCGSMIDRNTFVPSDLVDYIGTPSLNLIMQSRVYRNIDYSKMNEMLSQYMNITRPLILSERKMLLFSPDYVDPVEGATALGLYDGAGFNPHLINEIGSINNLPLCVPVTFESDTWESYGNVSYCPLKIHVYMYSTAPPWIGDDPRYVLLEEMTDVTGKLDINLQGLPTGYIKFNIEVEPEYEFYISPYINRSRYNYVIKMDDSVDLDVDLWEYVSFWGASTSSPILPYNDENEMLNTGRGFLVYTPVLNPEYVDTTSYHVGMTFYCGTRYARLGFGKIMPRPDYTPAQASMQKMLYLLNYTDTSDPSVSHTLDIEILEGIAYFYVDGDYIDESMTIEDGMNYVGGYNSAIIESITANDSASIVTPPTGGGAMILDIDHPENWMTQPNKDNNTLPSITEEGFYDVGRQYYNILNTPIFTVNTRNTTIEIRYTTTSTNYRIGLLFVDTDQNKLRWRDSYFNRELDVSSVTGNTHTLKFVCDNNGGWKTYLDDTRTNTAEFYIQDDEFHSVTRNISFLNYTTSPIIVEMVKIYDNE